MQSVRETLSGLGADLRPPADPVLIDRVVAELDITLPSDARKLYECANGSDGEFGEWMWHFLPIDSEELTLSRYLKRPREFVIASDQREIDPNKYVRFFDCLINAPLYAYCADRSSLHFGEVIGCYTDNGTFDAFASTVSVSRFLELLFATRSDECVLMDEKAAQPGATDNPDDAQRLREDH